MAEPQSEFDRYADSYAEALEDAVSFAGAAPDLYTQIKADLLIDLAARRVGEPGRLEVLDVGSGPGETDRLLQGRFGGLVGVDVSEGMVERASKSNPWAEYRAYREGEALPLEDGRFDLSFAICVMHHVPPSAWDGLVREMSRVTRPGGMVAIFEHNPWNPLTRKVVRDCEFDVDVALLSRRRTRELLSTNGLDVEESPYIIFFPREGARLRRIERSVARLPFGAQYYAAARRR